MDEKKNRPLVVEFEDCEDVFFANNSINAGSGVDAMKVRRSKRVSIHDNNLNISAMEQRAKQGSSSGATINLNGANSQFTVCSRDIFSNTQTTQIFTELKQKIAAIEEEGTRAQALDTIDEMEKTVGSGKCSQHYQKLTDLLRDYVEVYGPLLAALGASIGL
jgi:hypothetical protein